MQRHHFAELLREIRAVRDTAGALARPRGSGRGAEAHVLGTQALWAPGHKMVTVRGVTRGTWDDFVQLEWAGLPPCTPWVKTNSLSSSPLPSPRLPSPSPSPTSLFFLQSLYYPPYPPPGAGEAEIPAGCRPLSAPACC